MAEERTQPATPRRLEEARRRGQVAKSTEVNTAIVLLFSFLTLRLVGESIFEALGSNLEFYLSSMNTEDITRASIARIASPALQTMLVAGLPVIAVALAAGVLANLIQSGLLFSMHPLKPDLNRISPITGAKRLISMRAIVDLIRSLVKLSLLIAVFWIVVQDNVDEMMMLPFSDPKSSWLFIPTIVFETAMKATAVLVVIAAIDFVWQRYQHAKDLRMSHRDLRQEHKDTEGDPLMRGRMRELGRALATRRMMADVPTADVVITNPTEIAIALKYDSAVASAPTVVAKGEGMVAERIRTVAEAHDVPIVENVPLAQTLNRATEIGDEIPDSVYQAVAEVLAFVYKIKGVRVGRQ